MATRLCGLCRIEGREDMVSRRLPVLLLAMAVVAIPALVGAAPPLPVIFDWTTVVNNNDFMPGSGRWVNGIWTEKNFNSYNQPSVNAKGVVVIRARSRGGEGSGVGAGGGMSQPTHGIYSRDMSIPGNPIVRILDRTTEVPQPKNSSTKFVETPSFPRIDMWSDAIATRGNHQPVWFVSEDEGGSSDGAYGTTGIYANPFGTLVTGASKLGVLPEFGFFQVPGAPPGTPFDVFPGAPSLTNGSTIVFKGNYTVGGEGKTGVFYRNLEDADAGGTSPVMLIANNANTIIPGSRTVFGSTSPPSAAGKFAVFAGFDNEENPTLGSLYLVEIQKPKYLKPLVKIGARVPGGVRTDTFNRLGEAIAFDGRYVGFWGAWGMETRTVRLYCPTEGNKDRTAYCNQNLICYENGEPTGVVEEDPNSFCDETGCYQEKQVPVRQGIFLYDTVAQAPWMVAKTGAAFDDFVFWNYSGKPPCTGMMGHGQEGAEDDGEPARWRSSSFVAVSGSSTAFKASFKNSDGEQSGIYLNICSNPANCYIFTVLDTTMEGQDLDDQAPDGSKIRELGLEREGLRDGWLAINARMGVEGGTEEEGMAGVYVTRIK
jgi:hypothetical protein